MATESADCCLLTLPQCVLRSQGNQSTGEVEIHSVSIPPSPENQLAGDQVFLVFKCIDQEIPIEPSRICLVSSSGNTFTFNPSPLDSSTLILEVQNGDLELLTSILNEYCDLQLPDAKSRIQTAPPPSDSEPHPTGVHRVPPPPPPPHSKDVASAKQRPELAGQLILVNEQNGEVVGLVSDAPNIHEQSLGTQDPVIVEIDEDDTGNAMEVFVRAVPHQERDWVSWGAIGASKLMTGGTTLLISGVSAAGNWYMKRSKSEGAPGAPAQPPPAPPRFLTSPKARANLEMAQKYSGTARSISGKTVKAVDQMISRAMGSKSQASSSKLLSRPPPVPPTSAPSPQMHQAGEPLGHPAKLAPSQPIPNYAPPTYTSLEKPPQPRRSPSPQPRNMLNAPGAATPPGSIPPSTSQQPVTNRKARLMLSLNLILDTFDHNTKRVLEAGTQGMGAMVTHKYGKEAGDNTLLAAGAAKNVALVYVDVRGFTHRALLKRAGKHYIKSKMSSNKAGSSSSSQPPPPPAAQPGAFK